MRSDQLGGPTILDFLQLFCTSQERLGGEEREEHKKKKAVKEGKVQVGETRRKMPTPHYTGASIPPENGPLDLVYIVHEWRI